jgi:hypothetical protein
LCVAKRPGTLYNDAEGSASAVNSADLGGKRPVQAVVAPEQLLPGRQNKSSLGGEWVFDPQRAFRLDSSGRPIPADPGRQRARQAAVVRTNYVELAGQASTAHLEECRSNDSRAAPAHAQGRGVPWVPPQVQVLQGSTGRPISKRRRPRPSVPLTRLLKRPSSRMGTSVVKGPSSVGRLPVNNESRWSDAFSNSTSGVSPHPLGPMSSDDDASHPCAHGARAPQGRRRSSPGNGRRARCWFRRVRSDFVVMVAPPVVGAADPSR